MFVWGFISSSTATSFFPSHLPQATAGEWDADLVCIKLRLCDAADTSWLYMCTMSSTVTLYISIFYRAPR